MRKRRGEKEEGIEKKDEGVRTGRSFGRREKRMKKKKNEKKNRKRIKRRKIK